MYGKIRRRRWKNGKVSYAIDFYPLLKGPDRFLTSYSGVSFTSYEDALIVQQRIKAHVDLGKTLSEAVSAYRKPKDRRNQIQVLALRWMEWVESGSELEPYTVRGYRGHVNNQFEWWGNRTVDMIDWDLLFEWTVWMREEKGLAPKTIKNVLTTGSG